MGEGGMMSPQAEGGHQGHAAGGSADDSAGDSADHDAAAMPAASAAAARSAELGGISVKVTPANLADHSGDMLDFSVDLEAQDKALDFDLAKLAKLMVGSQEVAAAGWKVNFDHGHHVNGTLSFPLAEIGAALTPGAQIMLHISQPDGAGQAMLEWEMAE